jgi:hypothetical protein
MLTAAQPQTTFETIHVPPGCEPQFVDNYNKRPFVVEHRLAHHPLLQFSHLRVVAQHIEAAHPQHLYYTTGNLGVDRGWTHQSAKPSLERVFDELDSADAWIILKGAQIVPEYGGLLDRILLEIHELSGRDYRASTYDRNISIIITSPGRVTPYHMDADCNYLLQLAGSKTAYVFNGADRTVVTPAELEGLYLGDINAAKYKDECQSGTWQFELTPGIGIHVPVTFPHWVKNGSEVSISASINFCFQDRTIPDMHRLNAYLRRLGLSPKQPGESALSDAAKKAAIKTLRKVAWRKRR